MAWTQTQLDALDVAIVSGSLRVRYSDREVMYRSLDEMIRIRDLMRADLGLLGDNGGRSHMYAGFSKGLE